MLKNLTIGDFLSELASKSPAPGGGSAAALSAALGAALTAMVCNLTIGKKKYLDVSDEMRATLDACEPLRSRLLALVDEDTAAFNGIMTAFGLPKETDEEKGKRDAAIREATVGAIVVPLEVMQISLEVLTLTKIAAEKGNRNSISDAGVAALALRAGIRGALYNVQINMMGLADDKQKSEFKQRAETIMRQAEFAVSEILNLVEAAIAG